jgi:hypothetical protein
MKTQTNNFSISGKVIDIQPKLQFDKFAKRILVMEVMNGKWANKIEFEFINESMQQIDSIQRGDWVTVNFALKSRSSIKDGQERIYHSFDGLACYKE